jgi:ferredoxin
VADPAVFDQREDDGLVVLLTDSPDPSHAASVRSASAACPARAILVEE